MTKYYYGTNGNDVKTATKSGWGLWWEKWNMYGYGGNDNLTGGHDDDLIDRGSGADRMTGRKGNDTYIVDNVSDSVIEKSGEGFDTVRSYVTFTLSQNVESLQLQGNNAINGYGNSLGNLMHGNNKRNYLYACR